MSKLEKQVEALSFDLQTATEQLEVSHLIGESRQRQLEENAVLAEATSAKLVSSLSHDSLVTRGCEALALHIALHILLL